MHQNVALLQAGNHRQLAGHASDGCGLDNMCENIDFEPRCRGVGGSIIGFYALLTQHKTAEQFLHELVTPLLPSYVRGTSRSACRPARALWVN